MSVDLMNHVFQSLEKHFPSATPRGPQQPMPGIPALVEGPSPTADAGTAGVGSLYPVTCRARYYDAASTILEDEMRLFNHANANELGSLIEQWIESKRGNLGPR